MKATATHTRELRLSNGGDVAHVSAACGELDIADWRELYRSLKEFGFKSVQFERMKQGSWVVHKIEL